MSTADELRVLIESAKKTLSQKKVQVEQIDLRFDEAGERQRLRRELRSVQCDIEEQDSIIDCVRTDISNIDNDSNEPDAVRPNDSLRPMIAQPVQNITKFNANVARGEYVWKIEGMSWMVDALKQRNAHTITSPDDGYYQINKHEFDFRYEPLIGDSERGALLICFCNDETQAIPIRYKISVEKKGNGFEQLGVGSVHSPANKHEPFFFGPDADPQTGKVTQPRGIFGLSHEDLLNSDWVFDDTMTVKFEIELRVDNKIIHDAPPGKIAVPPMTLCDDMVSLLNSGKSSDVCFHVDGETIKAHTQILSARSEVFDKILNSGMSESITKEIVVNDCDAHTFKTLLQFIYADSCDSVLRELYCRNQKSDCNDSGDGDVSVQCLQNLLAASHKYAMSRLTSWCEQQLDKKLVVGNVCSVLCQAHLHDAKQLEKACLEMIRNRKHEVVVTEGFISLSRDWPEVMLKICMFDADVAGSDATSAVELLRRTSTNKRKRNE